MQSCNNDGEDLIEVNKEWHEVKHENGRVFSEEERPIREIYITCMPISFSIYVNQLLQTRVTCGCTLCTLSLQLDDISHCVQTRTMFCCHRYFLKQFNMTKNSTNVRSVNENSFPLLFTVTASAPIR